MRLARQAAALWLVLCAPNCVCLAASTPLAIDDVLTETSVNHERAVLGVSRDGQLFAYTQTRAAGISELWTVNLQTHTRRSVSQGLHSASSAIWSPDGKFLAFFVSDSDKPGVEHHYSIWLWERAIDASRQLTEPIADPQFPNHLIWTADSHYLITDIASNQAPASTSEGAKAPMTSSTAVTVHTDWVNLPHELLPADNAVRPEHQPNALLVDIGRIDVHTGAVERLATDVSPLTYAVGPDESIAVLSRDVTAGDQLDLWVTDNNSGRLRKLVSRIAVGRTAMSWSPDGKLLAIHSTNQPFGGEPEAGSGMCILVETASGKKTSFPADARSVDNLNVPLWTDRSDSVVLVERGRLVLHPISTPQESDSIAIPGGGAIESLLRDQLSSRLSDAMVQGRLVGIATEANGISMRVVTIDLSRKTTNVIADEFTYFAADAAAVVHNGTGVVLGVEGPAKPFDFFLVHLDSGKRERLTILNPQYDGYTFGAPRVIDYRNTTGDPRTGLLLLPSDYRPGTKYPTIVFERDRSNAWFARHFGFWGGPYNMELYATRGYAVLYPDIVLTRTPRERVTSDVIPGVGAAVATGIVDANRLALYGHSLGAYHAMMLLVQTHQFKAAIVSQGYYNLFTHYAENPGYTEGFVTGTFGPPWERPESYVANSPYFFLGQLTTPILLVGSSRDAYFEQGDALFAALQRANKPTEYIRYEDEAHNAASWSLGNRRDYVEHSLAWFNFWLLGKEDTELAKGEQYTRWRELWKLQEANRNRQIP